MTGQRHTSSFEAFDESKPLDDGKERDLRGFLEWAYGDLLSNTIRPLVAEWLVAKALGQASQCRVEWASYDIKHGDLRIEVKSAAYLQTWHNSESRPSVLSFDIAPRSESWDEVKNVYRPLNARAANVYVFCVFETRHREQADPLDVVQWSFFVLSSRILDEQFGKQKTVRLSRITPLAQRVSYSDLPEAIRLAGMNSNTV